MLAAPDGPKCGAVVVGDPGAEAAVPRGGDAARGPREDGNSGGADVGPVLDQGAAPKGGRVGVPRHWHQRFAGAPNGQRRERADLRRFAGGAGASRGGEFHDQAAVVAARSAGLGAAPGGIKLAPVASCCGALPAAVWGKARAAATMSAAAIVMITRFLPNVLLLSALTRVLRRTTDLSSLGADSGESRGLAHPSGCGYLPESR